MYLQAWMVTHPRRLAIEAIRFDLRVHRETTRALSDWPLLLLENGEYLLEHRCRFRLSRVHSAKDHVCRCESANLQSHLDVMVVSTFRLRKVGDPRTCHRVRIPPVFAFNATNFSRRSPDFHSSLRPDSFFFPRFGLIVFSHSSRSRKMLYHRQTHPRTGSRTTRTLRAPSSRCRVYAGLIVPCCRCRVTRGG